MMSDKKIQPEIRFSMLSLMMVWGERTRGVNAHNAALWNYFATTSFASYLI